MNEMNGSDPNKPARLKDRLREKLRENNALTQSISVISLILILAGLFAFITIGLRSYGLFRFPAFIENMISRDGGGGAMARAAQSDIYGFLASDRAERAETHGFSLDLSDLSVESVRGIIAATNLPDNFHLETEAGYFIDGALVRTIHMSLWKKGDKHKYRLMSNGILEELYVNNGAYEYIRNYITGSYTRRLAGTGFSFERVPHIKDINYYLDLIESGRITYHSINRHEGNVIRIIYEIEILAQRNIINISLDTGFVLSMRSYFRNDTDYILFYESATTVIEAYFADNVPDNTALTDGLFVIESVIIVE